MHKRQSPSQLSAEQVGEFIHRCTKENLKTLSESQKEMITPEALKDSPLRNPLACMLVSSEVMRFGKFEDVTPTLQSCTEDCKTVEDVIRLSVENWKKSYDVATVEGLLVPLLLAENGITTSSLNEYTKNSGQGQYFEIKRDASLSLLESHGFVTIIKHTKRCTLVSDIQMKATLEGIYFTGDSDRNKA
eukprot:TRINITY_DN1452_c0_g1_i20.p1 TRINITY_DN1452_c0_g1~~TRINITY_DN1452_c0_g1_i20.p1  ORF type:complete len:189 (-),score=30.51 TRINITY_DN1452_c0_g1_i20:813-1379(-)